MEGGNKHCKQKSGIVPYKEVAYLFLDEWSVLQICRSKSLWPKSIRDCTVCRRAWVKGSTNSNNTGEEMLCWFISLNVHVQVSQLMKEHPGLRLRGGRRRQTEERYGRPSCSNTVNLQVETHSEGEAVRLFFSWSIYLHVLQQMVSESELFVLLRVSDWTHLMSGIERIRDEWDFHFWADWVTLTCSKLLFW